MQVVLVSASSCAGSICVCALDCMSANGLQFMDTAFVQGMGLHGIPMGNMSNQQLMQMQLHGMDLQRIGMGLPGLPRSPSGLCST